MPVCESAGGEGRSLGPGLTKAKMAECRWLKPVLVAEIEFLEWTSDNHLRHSRFVGLREDSAARELSANPATPAPKNPVTPRVVARIATRAEAHEQKANLLPLLLGDGGPDLQRDVY